MPARPANQLAVADACVATPNEDFPQSEMLLQDALLINKKEMDETFVKCS